MMVDYFWKRDFINAFAKAFGYCILLIALTPNFCLLGQITSVELLDTSFYSLSGQVVNKKKEPLGFSNVYINSLQIGTSADENGVFVLDNIPMKGYFEVSISSVGYKSSTLVVDSTMADEKINLVLRKSVTELENIVITPGAYEIKETRSLSKQLIDPLQLENAPNLVQDVFRLLSLMPSASNSDYDVKPRIRGGDFLETGIYLDGFELINPFHLEISGGLQGLINTDYISNMEVLPGNFSVRYGDRLSGIVDLSSNTNFEKNQFTLSLDLLNAKFTGEVLIGEKWRFLTNFRRGYWDILVDLEAIGVNLVFYDTWNKLVFEPNENQLIEFSLLYGKDKFDYSGDVNNIEVQNYHSNIDKLYLWTNWKASISKSVFNRMTVGYQTLNKISDFEFESSFTSHNIDNSKFQMFSVADNLEFKINSNHRFSFGLEYRHINNDTQFKEERYNIYVSPRNGAVFDTINVNTQFDHNLYNAYADYQFKITKRLTSQFGVRLSSQSFSEGVNIAPRWNVNYKIGDHIDLAFGMGVFYQPDNYFDLKSEFGQETLTPIVSRADHFSGNLTWEKEKHIVQVGLYHKNYKRMNDRFRLRPSERFEIFKTYERSFNAISGKSSGLEFNYKHNSKKGLFNLSMAYNVSTMKNEGGVSTSQYGEIPINLGINYVLLLKNNYTISTSFVYRSGSPFTEVLQSGGISKDNGISPVLFYNLGQTNSERHSGYKSFDLRISKKWVKKNMQVEASLNFLNVANFSNVRNIYYEGSILSDGNVGVSRNRNTYFPILISPGLKIGF